MARDGPTTDGHERPGTTGKDPANLARSFSQLLLL